MVAPHSVDAFANRRLRRERAADSAPRFTRWAIIFFPPPSRAREAIR